MSPSPVYDKEQKTAKITNAAMIIAIFVSCMGLFGLVTFTAEQRTREIGIRKVLGASVSSIVTMCQRTFYNLSFFRSLLLRLSPGIFYIAGYRTSPTASRSAVGICSCRVRCDSNGPDHSQLSGYQGCYCQPREKPEDRLIRKGSEYITETRSAYVDSTFFNVFAFPALEGDTGLR